MTNTIDVRPYITGKFCTSSTYDVGDLVFYYDKLYKCVLAVLIPGEFDESKWTQTTIADELLAVKAWLNDTN